MELRHVKVRSRPAPHWRSTWCTDSLVPIYDGADGDARAGGYGTPAA